MRTTGYDMVNEVFDNIGLDGNHEISLNDMIRVISFFGFNEEASSRGKIGFICTCARNKVKKIFEKALVWGDFSGFDEMIEAINKNRSSEE